MSVKTNGAEFKEYYHDDVYWAKDAWHDDHAIKVNDEYIDDIEDDNIPDDATVEIESGIVYVPVRSESGYEEKEIQLVTHFKNWRKQLKYKTVIVQVEKDKVDDIISAIKSIPGVNNVK
ncbi:hypothetical protein FDI76_gp136 [Serratia phage vB_Sru_IME250]|uniref:Uncharacterized protein n=1 Tax=Serratia phage vB_Sru_IME250 TaxID=1852640 RepID=A0A1J0MG66_9CAUD|nr:hypothetical protein FDI76_gp136 [Serratia phage vB_Sru_IME250]ANM47259.1 hypothetical protein [Serratia phage vB_Sru_IME250]APD20167.1 hypothetical protein [Serratia phage vB_Sru_IME250]